MERSWNEVKSNWDQHVQRIRERIDSRKAELDAGIAAREAQWAEVDARDAIDFAAAAIVEAEYAALDAVQTRAEATAWPLRPSALRGSEPGVEQAGAPGVEDPRSSPHQP